MIDFKRLPLRVTLSYLFDYVIVIGFIVAFAIIGDRDPFHQHFSLENYTLQYPYKDKDTVSVLLCGVLAVLFPAAMILIYTIVIDGFFSNNKPNPKVSFLPGPWRFKDRLWELNCGILGLLLAVSAAFTITGSLKNLIGKPRPDLIARCQPKSGSRDPAPYGLSDISICGQTNQEILQDGFRSFPSGHSSTAFAGLYYLSLYLAGKLHVLDSKGEVWKTLIVLIPSLGAALIAGSRIMDARHHPFDVISGSLLGILVAWGSYRQYFPAISEPWHKGRAYPIRSWGKPPTGPGYVRTPDDFHDGSKRTASGSQHDDPETGLARRNNIPEAAHEKPLDYQQQQLQQLPRHHQPQQQLNQEGYPPNHHDIHNQTGGGYAPRQYTSSSTEADIPLEERPPPFPPRKQPAEYVGLQSTGRQFSYEER